MSNDNNKKKLRMYNVEMSFIRPYQESGVFACAAENEEDAKKHMEKLFEDHPNLKIHRVYLIEDVPQLHEALPPHLKGSFEEAEVVEDEDKKEPTIN